MSTNLPRGNSAQSALRQLSADRGAGRVVGGPASSSSSSTGSSPNRPADRSSFHPRDAFDDIAPHAAANAAHRNLPSAPVHRSAAGRGDDERARSSGGGGGHRGGPSYRPTATADADAARLHAQKEGWTQVTSNPSTSGRPPCQRSLHAAAMLRDSMYVFGGYDGLHRVNDLYEYHFPSRSWRQIIALGQHSDAPGGTIGVGVVAATGTAPSPRDRHTAVAHGTSFYV